MYYRQMETTATKPVRTVGQPALSLRWSRAWKNFYIFAFTAITAAYLLLTLVPKPAAAVLKQYDISAADYRLLIYPAVILLVISWTLSLIGSLRVKSYSRLIGDSADGKALGLFAAAFMVLTICQPLISLLGNIFAHIEQHTPHALKPLTILLNYLNLLWVGVTFALLAYGATKLYGLVSDANSRLSEALWAFAFIIFSSVYSYFLVIQPIHTPLAQRIYYLPDWLLALTIGAPYVFFWYLGVRAAYQLYLYQRVVAGKIYRHSLRYLAAGVVAVIISSIANRTIITLSTHLSSLSLTPVLFIVYALIAINAMGFILIAIGASRLKRIEEV